MNTTVSICIPAYHAERFLPEALESIRHQTFPGWEVVVVEDGSRDGAEAIVAAFAASVEQSVRYLRHTENRGLTATRNTGINAAASDWVALLDADDLWESDHLEACMEKVWRGESDIIHGASVLFDGETGMELGHRKPTEAEVRSVPVSVFTGAYLVQPSSVVFRKDLWQRVGGFNTAFQHVEDHEMWLRCLRAGARLCYTGCVTCRYRKHRNAMSTASYPMAESASRVYAQHLDWEAIPGNVRRNCYRDALVAAGRLCWRKAPERAAQHFRMAFGVSREARCLAWALGCGLAQALRGITCRIPSARELPSTSIS